jgi:hypothetical protein
LTEKSGTILHRVRLLAIADLVGALPGGACKSLPAGWALTGFDPMPVFELNPPLVPVTGGSFSGTTLRGGTFGYGTVYSFYSVALTGVRDEETD